MSELGLCLLKRGELKRECSVKTALKLQKKLSQIKGFKQEIINGNTKQRIANLVFLKTKENFKDYDRFRVRAYYQDNLNSVDDLKLERRVKKGVAIRKQRKDIWAMHLLGVVLSLRKLGFFESLFVDYERTTFFDNARKVRVTFDSDINYFGLPKRVSHFEFGDFLGKENVVIVKIKFNGKCPVKVKNLLRGLEKSRSKVKRGLYFKKKKENW